VYLSATIDRRDGFEFYQKDIREMINKGYLCDYLIKVPIFSNDPTNGNICEYLIKMYRNIIVYCNTQKEGRNVTKKFNELRKGCAEYIDCNTPKKKRNDILKRYNDGKIAFLVNVAILCEGFDSPITQGIVFLHMPSSHVKLIQIIGRALRLHKDKKYANIILPYSVEGDVTSIGKFLKIMAKNDSRIRKTYMNRKLGGYISIDTVEENDNSKNTELAQFRYEEIFNSFGKIFEYGEGHWFNMLDQVKNFIDKNSRIPLKHIKNIKEKQLREWIDTQNKTYRLRKYVMKFKHINDTWNDFINSEKYAYYFFDNKTKWNNKLSEVKNFIDIHKRIPSKKDKDIIGWSIINWLNLQKDSYKKRKKHMSQQYYYNEWAKFLKSTYGQYVLDKNDIWEINFKNVKEYIDINNKVPSSIDKNKTVILLGRWLVRQMGNFKHSTRIMTKSRRIKFHKFIEVSKYKKYFISNKDQWRNNLKILKDYLDKYDRRPLPSDANKIVASLGIWCKRQHIIYKNPIEIMIEEDIYNEWRETISMNKYSKHFMSKDELWNHKLVKLKEYIDIHNRLPSARNDDEQTKTLGLWVQRQRTYYTKTFQIMKNITIRKIWEDFINDDLYEQYFVQ
jgi:superfamily II DNA/RNA helicase